MNAIPAMCLSHLALLALGSGIVAGLHKTLDGMKVNLFAFLSMSYLVGELSVVILLTASSFLFSAFLWPALWLASGVSLLFFIRQKIRLGRKESDCFGGGKDAPSLKNLAPVGLIILICLPHIPFSFFHVQDQHDPRYMWLFHGKAFFYDNQVDPSYLKNPEYAWSQPHYPIFIPLLSVYHARILGGWHEILNKSFIYFHWLAGLILFFFLLRNRGVPPALSLLGIAFLPFIYHKYAMTGYGDSIWGLNFMLGILFSLDSLEKGPKTPGRFSLLAGSLFFSMAALTKLEGLAGSLVFLALMSIVFLAGRGPVGRYLFYFLGPFVLCVFPWYAFAAAHGLKGLHPRPLLGFLRYGAPELVQRAKFIFTFPFLEKLLIPQVYCFMVGSLGLTLALLLWNIKRFKSFLSSWLILSANILILLVYFAMYLGNPLLEFELKYGLERILSVNFMLCLLALLDLSRSEPGSSQRRVG